jgi:hypothetical protein
VKAQQILSTGFWGSKPSLLSGFITIVGGVYIILVSKKKKKKEKKKKEKKKKKMVPFNLVSARK